MVCPVRHDVFVSHNGLDKPVAERLCRALLGEGLRPWFDRWDLIPGELWVRKVEQVLDEVPAVLVCIGKHGMSEWADTERLVALDNAKSSSQKVIPVLLPGAPPKVELPPFLRAHWSLDLREEVAWEADLHRLANTLLGREPKGPWIDTAGTRPYRGLESFTEEDAGWMFGREQEEADLLNELRDGHRFITVIGASGSGKSSLVRAAVVPSVRTGGVDGRHRWYALVMRPGSDPCDRLARRLLELQRMIEGKGTDIVEDGDKLKELGTRLRREEGRLLKTVDLLLDRDGRDARLLLVVDQLEELFIAPRRREMSNGERGDQEDEPMEQGAKLQPEGAALLRNLFHATGAEDSRVRVIVTVRGDFMGECLEVPGLASHMKRIKVAVPPMDENQLRAAILRPAARVGYEVEAALVDVLVSATKNQPECLPLLQYALDQLWMNRDHESAKLTYDTYCKHIGSLEESIVRKAEKVLGRLVARSPEYETATRSVFLRLVHLGEGTRDVRRQVPRSMLSGEVVSHVLDAFTKARLLVSDSHQENHEQEVVSVSTVEIAHEALLWHWDRLKRWLDESREARRMLVEVAPAALAWKRHRYSDDELWRGRRLDQAFELLTNGSVDLEIWERSFLIQSRQEERNAEQERVRQLRRRIGSGVAFILLLAVLLVVAYDQYLEADALAITNAALARSKEDEARAARIAARQAQGARALLLANAPNRELEALEAAIRATGTKDEEGFSRSQLFYGLKGPLDRARRVDEIRRHIGSFVVAEWTADGQWVATGGEDGSIIVWSADTNEERVVLRGHAHAVTNLKWTDDGARLASGSVDGTVGLWDRDPGAGFSVLGRHTEAVSGMGWSRDGKSLATGSADRTVRVWDAETRALLGTLEDDHVQDGAVTLLLWASSNRSLITLTEAGTATLWNWNGESGGFVFSFIKQSVESARALQMALEGSFTSTFGRFGEFTVDPEQFAERLAQACSILATFVGPTNLHGDVLAACGPVDRARATSSRAR